MNYMNMDNAVFNVQENDDSYLVITAKPQCVFKEHALMSFHTIKIQYWLFVGPVKKIWNKNLFHSTIIRIKQKIYALYV